MLRDGLGNIRIGTIHVGIFLQDGQSQAVRDQLDGCIILRRRYKANLRFSEEQFPYSLKSCTLLYICSLD